jgi:hypothetical protein
MNAHRFFDRRFTSLTRLRAGCEDDAIAEQYPHWDVLPEVARSLLADGYPELARHLSRHLD